MRWYIDVTVGVTSGNSYFLKLGPLLRQNSPPAAMRQNEQSCENNLDLEIASDLDCYPTFLILKFERCSLELVLILTLIYSLLRKQVKST